MSGNDVGQWLAIFLLWAMLSRSLSEITKTFDSMKSIVSEIISVLKLKDVGR